MAKRSFKIMVSIWTILAISENYGKRPYKFKEHKYFFETKEEAQAAFKEWIESKINRYKSAKVYEDENGFTCVDVRMIHRTEKYKAIEIHGYNIK